MTVQAGDETTDQGEQQQQEPRQLREAFDRVSSENKAKDDLLRDMVFKLAGVDITKGRGKTARGHYDGDLTEDAVRTYMRENYEWEPEQTTTTVSAEVGSQIAEAQQRIQDAGQGPGTQSGNNEASIPQQIDEAEAKGDWQRAMALKKSWFGNLMNRSR